MDDKYTAEVKHRYGDIRCPVAILQDADDEWIPLKDGDELARRVGVPLRIVPAAKHLMQEDAPEAITAAVLDFWREQDR